MVLNDIIEGLKANGWGGVDFLTGETVADSVQLDESINGDGGLTVSWKSASGGMIRGGTTFMGYVMKENYVPTLGRDGLYSWSPKFSEPAVLLDKNNYCKQLLLSFTSAFYQKGDAVATRVVAVVADDVDLPARAAAGSMAIVTGNDPSRLRTMISGRWLITVSPVAGNALCQLGNDEHYYRYCGGRWTDIGEGNGRGSETSTVYTSVFSGPVRTIIEDLRSFFVSSGLGFTIELRSEKSDPAAAAADIATLQSKIITVTFDGSSIRQFINDIAEQAEANVYYVGRRIILGRTMAYCDTDFFNRFVVLGGNKNMAKRTATGQGYAAITQRLHLDETAYPGSVIDLREDKTEEAPFETFLVFDDIYPKLNLTIGSVSYCLCYLLDENGNQIADGNGGYKLYAKWYVTFNLNGSLYQINKDYIIQDKPLSVLFQSGPLTGRQFEMTMLTAGATERNSDGVNAGDKEHTVAAGECYIILEADGELLLPGLPATYDGGGLCPQAGNLVTLVNVAIEDSLRVAAQEELLTKGMERARLIYESKQPTMSEEHTFTDVITREGGETLPALGEAYRGYVVTGISADLITGVTTVSYGTFKPKGLLRSAIDKIESYSLSGGAATQGKDVRTGTDGGAAIIYVRDPNDGGDNSSAGSKGSGAGGTNQLQNTVIRQAGGNTNIKTVYETIASMSTESGVADVFAGLATELWAHRGGLETKWDIVTLFFTRDHDNPDTEHCYEYYGGVLYYDGISLSDSDLTAAFASVATVLGDVTQFVVTVGSSFPSGPGKYDMLIEGISVTVEGDTVEGGIRAWLYRNGAWGVVLTSTTALIENLGNAVRLLVFGAVDGDIPGMIEASGMLTTQNFVKLFSEAQFNGQTLTEAMLGIGIKYHVEAAGEWRDVFYHSSDAKWYYSETDPLEEYDGDEGDIVPYSYGKMSADKIEFTGKTIDLSSEDGIQFHSCYAGSDLIALKIDGIGRVSLADTSISNATVNGVLTAENSRIFLKSFSSTQSHPISPYTGLVVRSPDDDIYSHHVIELGMKEFSVSSGKSSNSFLNLFSFKNDWSTSLGYIKMKCGDGNGTGTDDRASEIRMGVSDAEDSVSDKDVVRIMAYRSSNDSLYNYIAVRGRFAVIGSSGEIYGITKTVTIDGHTITVSGGIITNIT